MKKIKVRKVIYPLWKEIKEAKLPINLFHKWQYIYSSAKGKISLVKLKNYRFLGDSFWEIYSLEGNLFEGTERFETKEEAERRIKELLDGSAKGRRGDESTLRE